MYEKPTGEAMSLDEGNTSPETSEETMPRILQGAWGDLIPTEFIIDSVVDREEDLRGKIINELYGVEIALDNATEKQRDETISSENLSYHFIGVTNTLHTLVSHMLDVNRRYSINLYEDVNKLEEATKELSELQSSIRHTSQYRKSSPVTRDWRFPINSLGGIRKFIEGTRKLMDKNYRTGQFSDLISKLNKEETSAGRRIFDYEEAE